MAATSSHANVSLEGKQTSELTRSEKLEDQAATAAMYVTQGHGNRHESRDDNRFLDSNNKLSSAGAAASLKYARPQDLPSFPSRGLANGDSAAGAAASLGWGAKAPEYWKPEGTSASASKAAMIAKDYKMAPLWQPEQSANGAKAALLAHKDGSRVDIWQPEPTAWGNSAANQAMKSGKDNALSPKIDYGYSDLGRKGSIMAASGAMSNSRRKRADSTPVVKAPTYPDEANAVANALSAATAANMTGRGSRAEYSSDVGAVPYTNFSREMYTSAPPVAAEVEERNRQDVLHASAIAMAKKMYTIQQNQIEALARAHSTAGAVSAHGRNRSASESSDDVAPMRFNNLQEAAQKLAQERLAKLHDEHAQNREYRSYYGGENYNKPANRLSLRGRPGRRASSDGELDEDRQQSQKIRAQMSLFNSNLSQVDNKKRQADRDALMAAAQRNVTARLSGMDEKVFRDTGKVAPSMLNEWEVKAHAAAQKNSDTRMENYGKINIGGGKFINQSAIDLVARKNVQPVLDEINEKAEQQRVRDAELKLEQEARKRELETKKQREREVKEINKKLKVQDKEEARVKKAEEKREKERLKKQQRANTDAETSAPTADTTDDLALTVETSAATTEAVPVATLGEPRSADRQAPGYQAPTGFRTSMEDQQSERLNEVISDGRASGAIPKSAKKGGWFKRFSSRRESKTSGSAQKEKPFVGGAALTGASTTSVHNSSVHNDDAATASITSPTFHEEIGRGRTTERPISPISTVSSLSAGAANDSADETEDEFEEARDDFKEDLAPTPAFPAEKSSSPSRTSKFTEVV